MRAVTDFEAEFDMALMNKKMAPGIESVYLMASLEHLFISGTRIREVSGLGYDVSDLVPPHVWSGAAEEVRGTRLGRREARRRRCRPSGISRMPARARREVRHRLHTPD